MNIPITVSEVSDEFPNTLLQVDKGKAKQCYLGVAVYNNPHNQYSIDVYITTSSTGREEDSSVFSKFWKIPLVTNETANRFLHGFKDVLENVVYWTNQNQLSNFKWSTDSIWKYIITCNDVSPKSRISWQTAEAFMKELAVSNLIGSPDLVNRVTRISDVDLVSLQNNIINYIYSYNLPVVPHLLEYLYKLRNIYTLTEEVPLTIVYRKDEKGSLYRRGVVCFNQYNNTLFTTSLRYGKSSPDYVFSWNFAPCSDDEINCKLEQISPFVQTMLRVMVVGHHSVKFALVRDSVFYTKKYYDSLDSITTVLS